MFITCGEALFDVFANQDAGGDPLGFKAQGVIGGSPLNVALGLVRMGNKAGMFTRVSTDSLGAKIKAFMHQNAMSERYCVATDNPTTFVLVNTRPDGQPDYSFYCTGTADCSMEMADIPASLDDDVSVIHLGSLTTVLEPTASVLRAFAQQQAGKRFITYDPNVRAMVEPDADKWRSVADELMGVANMVKASDEDLEFLYPGQALEAFIEKGLLAGADIVAVTRGAGGAIIGSSDGRIAHIDGVKIDVIDTVGAGDTFQAASIHYVGAQQALQKGKACNVDIAELGRFATHAAALTCTRRGADLPTLAEINAFMAAR